MTTTCSRCGRVHERDFSDFTYSSYGGHVLGGDLSLTWTGSQGAPVCPGCRAAAWFPYCQSWRDDSGYGKRFDLEALRRGEWVAVDTGDVPVSVGLSDLDGERVLVLASDPNSAPEVVGLSDLVDDPDGMRELAERLGLGTCDYVDRERAWYLEEGEFPTSEWRCPACGGDVFVWVNADDVAPVEPRPDGPRSVFRREE